LPDASEHSGLAEAQRKLLFVLGVATFMVSLDGRVVAPLLPSIASEFRVSISTAGYLVSGYLLPYGLFQLAYGALADRFGKVRVAAWAMVAFSAGTALCGVFGSFPGVLVARAFTGAAAAALIPLTIAYIGEVVPYSRRQASLAMLMASSGAAQAFSTSLGGLVAVVVSWRQVFPLLGASSGVVTLWLFSQVKHELRRARPVDAPRYRDALRTPLRPLLGLVLVEGALFMGCFPFLSGLLEQRFGLGALWIGVVLGAGGASQVVAARLMPSLLRLCSETGLVVLGALAMGLAYLLRDYPARRQAVGGSSAVASRSGERSHADLPALDQVGLHLLELQRGLEGRRHQVPHEPVDRRLRGFPLQAADRRSSALQPDAQRLFVRRVDRPPFLAAGTEGPGARRLLEAPRPRR
jgi:predicted MFS family arabinose efflux permease